jgi:hypothetical protein
MNDSLPRKRLRSSPKGIGKMKASVLTTDEVGLSRIQERKEIKEPTSEKSSQRRGDRERGERW